MGTSNENRIVSALVAGMLVISTFLVFAQRAQPEECGSTVAFDPASHQKFEVVRQDSGFEIKLMGLAVLPYNCALPDSSIPIEIPCGPNPYSHSIALFVAREAVEIEVDLLDLEMNLLASVDFGQVGAGPYGVNFTGPSLSPGIYWIQVSHIGKVVGRAKYAFVGSG